MTREIDRLSDIEGRFDAVLIDQYGVLHDGRAPFDGAIACVARLAERRVPIVALSNSGKRAGFNADRMAKLGFPHAWFDGVVTSGELAHARLGAMLAEGRLSSGDGVAMLMRGEDGSALEGHALRRVAPEDAPRLLLIAGTEPERRTREAYRALLAPLAAAGVPALCINPDRHIYVPGGSAFGPGLVAEDYEAAGGSVTLLGKPGAEMFAAGLAMLGHPDPKRVLMIGDSPQHDIAGAQAAGCATLLIRSGVQGGEAGAAPDLTIGTLR